MDNQNQNPETQPLETPQPINPPAQDTQPQLHHQPGVLVQPSETFKQELQTQGNGQTQNTGPQVPSQPQVPTVSSIYPEPTKGVAGTTAYSKSDFEKEEKNKKKSRKLLTIGATTGFVLIVAVLGFGWWYQSQDHSIYSKLTTENYDLNGHVFSFEYPAVMKTDTPLLKQLASDNTTNSPDIGTPVAYYYKPVATSKLPVVTMSLYFLNVGGLLNQLDLTPSQMLSQVKAKSGSYVDLFNHANPTDFDSLYKNCNNYITNINNQKSLICATNKTSAITVTSIIGVTSTYQYNLEFFVANSVWSAHPKVWQEVEKSFTYQ